MPNSDDEYIKKGTICRCRHCQTTVEVTEIDGMMVEYKAIDISKDDIQQQVFAVFCIDFEKLDDQS